MDKLIQFLKDYEPAFDRMILFSCIILNSLILDINLRFIYVLIN